MLTNRNVRWKMSPETWPNKYSGEFICGKTNALPSRSHNLEAHLLFILFKRMRTMFFTMFWPMFLLPYSRFKIYNLYFVKWSFSRIFTNGANTYSINWYIQHSKFKCEIHFSLLARSLTTVNYRINNKRNHHFE